MAQRNPMNDRYRGEGPVGQTKKSAGSIKPATPAAASVHVKSKPTTPQEKRAAAKRREKEQKERAAEKTAEKARKAERQQREQAELDAQSEQANNAAGASKALVAAPAKPKKEGFFTRLKTPLPGTDTAEYKLWRRRYWMLLGGGAISVSISWVLNVYLYELPVVGIIFLVLAYVFIIGAFIIDFRKVKPLTKAAQRGGASNANKSPKQLKHEQEAAERAAALEAERKAAKESKRGKLLFAKKAGTAGEEAATEDAATAAPAEPAKPAEPATLD